MYDAFIPPQVNANPDYLIGVEGGHLVRVPAAVAASGQAFNQTVSPITGIQAGPGLSVTLPNGLTVNGSTTMSPAAGAVTINPTTQGAINNMTIGQATPAGGRFTSLGVGYTDHGAAATPVATTTFRGRVRIPLGATSVQVTNGSILATSAVLISQRSLDTTLTRAIAVAAAGSFTITGNAAATADTDFDYVVVFA